MVFSTSVQFWHFEQERLKIQCSCLNNQNQTEKYKSCGQITNCFQKTNSLLCSLYLITWKVNAERELQQTRRANKQVFSNYRSSRGHATISSADSMKPYATGMHGKTKTAMRETSYNHDNQEAEKDISSANHRKPNLEKLTQAMKRQVGKVKTICWL